MHTDRIPAEARADAIRRLRRAEGQIRALVTALEDGGDCRAVIHQLTAARNAVGRAGVRLLSAGLTECLMEAAADDLEPAEFEKLFMGLA